MNELDLIRQQNTIFGELAKELLENETLIKRQQRDALDPNIKDQRLQTAIRDEMHARALRVLQFEKIGKEYLASEEAATETNELEKFYNNLYEQNHKQDVKQLVSELLKALITFVTELLTKWDRFVKDVMDQIAHLQMLFNRMIAEDIHFILENMRQKLAAHYEVYSPLPDKIIDYKQLFQILFMNMEQKIKEGKLTLYQFETMMIGGPYIKGELIMALEDARVRANVFTDNEKMTLMREIWKSFQIQSHYQELRARLQPLSEIQYSVLYLNQIQNSAVKEEELLKMELSEAYGDFTSLRGVANKSEVRDLHKISQRKLQIIPHIITQGNDFISCSRESMAFVEQHVAAVMALLVHEAKDDNSFLSRPM